MSATAIKTNGATPTQIRLHRERQERLRRLGIIERLHIPAPQPPQERRDPIPAPETPPEPAPPPVEAVAAAEDDRPPSFSSIVRAVCQKYEITKAQLTGQCRQLEVCRARHEAFFRLYTERGMSLLQVGRMLGGFDHTTVLNGIRRHKGRMGGEIDKRHSISWTQEVRCKAEAMRRAGATLLEIGTEIGCSQTAVSAAFSRWRKGNRESKIERIAQWAAETRAA